MKVAYLGHLAPYKRRRFETISAKRGAVLRSTVGRSSNRYASQRNEKSTSLYKLKLIQNRITLIETQLNTK